MRLPVGVQARVRVRSCSRAEDPPGVASGAAALRRPCYRRVPRGTTRLGARLHGAHTILISKVSREDGFKTVGRVQLGLRAAATMLLSWLACGE